MDFIYGSGMVVFVCCEIYCWVDGYIMVVLMDENVLWGYVFFDCWVMVVLEVSKGVYLGCLWWLYVVMVFVWIEFFV